MDPRPLLDAIPPGPLPLSKRSTNKELRRRDLPLCGEFPPERTRQSAPAKIDDRRRLRVRPAGESAETEGRFLRSTDVSGRTETISKPTLRLHARARWRGVSVTG